MATRANDCLSLDERSTMAAPHLRTIQPFACGLRRSGKRRNAQLITSPTTAEIFQFKIVEFHELPRYRAGSGSVSAWRISQIPAQIDEVTSVYPILKGHSPSTPGNVRA